MSDKITFSDFIIRLADKAGIPSDDKSIIDILSNAELNKATVSKAFVDAVDNGLLTVDDAKNNHPLIAPAYRASVLNGLDASINTLIDDLDLDEETINEIKGIRSTFKRNEAIIQALKAQSKKQPTQVKHEPSDNKTADLIKQRDELIAALEKEKADRLAAIEEIKGAGRQEMLNYKLSSLLSKKRTKFDNDDAEVRDVALRTILNKKLSEKNGIIGMSEDGRLELQNTEGNNLMFDNHKTMSVDDFIDFALADVIEKRPAQQSTNAPAKVIDVAAVTAANASNKRGAEHNRQQREALENMK